MAKMTDDYFNSFLEKTRYAHITTLDSKGFPRTVPVWFHWDGERVRIFTGANSSKAKRIRNDPRISVLVANDVDEHEAWVSFEGNAAITQDGVTEFVGQLAQKYWDLSDPKKRSTLESWLSEPQHLCTIELIPDKILTYYD